MNAIKIVTKLCIIHSLKGHHQTAITTNLVSSINARSEGILEIILCDKVL